MWTCKYCETVNIDDDKSCVCCTKERDVVVDPPPKKKPWWIAILVAVTLLVVGYFTIHIYIPATCTSPATCVICGKTNGTTLNHRWGAWYVEKKATCTEDGKQSRDCLNNGSHKQTKLIPTTGHDWMEATYDAPMTCRTCGITSGKPLNRKETATPTVPSSKSVINSSLRYVGDMDGYFGTDTLELIDGSTTHPFLLKKPQTNVASFTMHLCINSYTGDPFGYWSLFGSTGVAWDAMESFSVNTNCVGNWQSYTFDIGCWEQVNALAILTPYDQECSVNYNVYFDDLWVWN